MTNEPLIEQVYRQAYADVLFDHAQHVLCPQCSKVLETAALDRYKTQMVKRRQEVDTLRAKIDKERERDQRSRELGGSHE